MGKYERLDEIREGICDQWGMGPYNADFLEAWARRAAEVLGVYVAMDGSRLMHDHERRARALLEELRGKA